jgi:hypothetical protein
MEKKEYGQTPLEKIPKEKKLALTMLRSDFVLGALTKLGFYRANLNTADEVNQFFDWIGPRRIQKVEDRYADEEAYGNVLETIKNNAPEEMTLLDTCVDDLNTAIENRDILAYKKTVNKMVAAFFPTAKTETRYPYYREIEEDD